LSADCGHPTASVPGPAATECSHGTTGIRTRYRHATGVDGSPQSTAALRWAVAEAVMRDEELTIVHVSPLIGGWSGVGLSGSPLAEETVEWQQQGAQRLIEDALQTARDCAGGASLRISTEMPSASVVPTLIDLTKQARMIVVGSSGQGALTTIRIARSPFCTRRFHPNSATGRSWSA
jgi:nucleotide-binding universal stress UspA family protein